MSIAVLVCRPRDFEDLQQAHTILERTKTRPLASGRISLFSASIFVFIQYLTGICFFYTTTSGIACVSFLTTQKGMLTINQALRGLVPTPSSVRNGNIAVGMDLIFVISFAIYPLLKRITYWPQAWLGIAMNFGFITAWISTAGFTDMHLTLAAMIACWW